MYVYVCVRKYIYAYQQIKCSMLLARCKVAVSYNVFVNDDMGSWTVVKYVHPIYYVTLHFYQNVAWIRAMALWLSPPSTSSFM